MVSIKLSMYNKYSISSFPVPSASLVSHKPPPVASIFVCYQPFLPKYALITCPSHLPHTCLTCLPLFLLSSLGCYSVTIFHFIFLFLVMCPVHLHFLSSLVRCRSNALYSSLRPTYFFHCPFDTFLIEEHASERLYQPSTKTLIG